MVGENPVEPLQKLEFLGRFRPRPVVEAATRNPEQRALPDYGQPRLQRDHRALPAGEPPMSIEIIPTGAAFGAEIRGADLARSIV
jgi:hypothetical protein